jgi:hypothetical protein
MSEEMSRYSFVVVFCLGLLTGLGAYAQAPGAPFGTREPRVCPPRKIVGVPNADQARALFICDHEQYVGGYVYLVSDVAVQIGKSRPFDSWYDKGHSDIDVAAKVYPIKGNFSVFQCSRRDAMLGQDPSRNCMRTDFVDSTGTCYLSTFAEWHCDMGGGRTTTVGAYQGPPAGP